MIKSILKSTYTYKYKFWVNSTSIHIIHISNIFGSKCKIKVSKTFLLFTKNLICFLSLMIVLYHLYLYFCATNCNIWIRSRNLKEKKNRKISLIHWYDDNDTSQYNNHTLIYIRSRWHTFLLLYLFIHNVYIMLYIGNGI